MQLRYCCSRGYLIATDILVVNARKHQAKLCTPRQYESVRAPGLTAHNVPATLSSWLEDDACDQRRILKGKAQAEAVLEKIFCLEEVPSPPSSSKYKVSKKIPLQRLQNLVFSTPTIATLLSNSYTTIFTTFQVQPTQPPTIKMSPSTKNIPAPVAGARAGPIHYCVIM